jgi:hypothetical protein
MMFPYGNVPDNLSIFLDFADAAITRTTNLRWHKCVQFSIRMHNPFNAKAEIVRGRPNLTAIFFFIYLLICAYFMSFFSFP